MIGRRTWSRPASITVLGVVYTVAAAVGLAVAESLPGSETLLAGFAADLAATAVVFAASVALNNTSVYDPYWSVAPPLLAVWWACTGDGGTGRSIVVVAVVSLWGLRLTANFLSGWRGLNHEDWRYTEYRRLGTIGYWGVSLGGLHLIPTLVVFAGLLPVHAATAGTEPGFGIAGVAAAGVALVAVWIESTADLQKRRFRPEREGEILSTGLWSLVRHPNYLGEILFWWGLALFGVAAGVGWTMVGAVTVTALFLGISIPLMERRMRRRPGYRAHAAAVPPLLPSPASLPRWFSRATWRT